MIIVVWNVLFYKNKNLTYVVECHHTRGKITKCLILDRAQTDYSETNPTHEPPVAQHGMF